jgi:hypothetical protein
MNIALAAQADGTLTDGEATAVTGAHGEQLRQFFVDCGLQCSHVDAGEFTSRMLQKLMWSSVMWLVCHAHGGITVCCFVHPRHLSLQQATLRY